MKKKVAATSIVAAAMAEMMTSVVKLDFVGCFGRDVAGVTLAAGAEASAAMVTACSRRSGVSGVVVRTLSGGTMSVGTFLRGMRVRMSLRRFGFCRTGVGGTGVGESGATGLAATGVGRTGLGDAWLCETWPGGTALGETGLVAASEAFGALGRGT